ncbi:CopG family transcriptional regulator [Natronomonas halophila]|uniref:CopG family transcriptional regulator n=1 Tax=Natronomonas halophila TaxID=2747817 RepID=UPI0015B5A24B|nr:CopG family transcriptional regulator [Natronomonas halophila]QLD87126.1 CopG family transcriptional regulator [Natronomonas halophila]
MTENPPSNDRTASEERPDQTWCVRLPDHVGTKIEQRLPETNFESVEEYVTFALEALLRELDEGEHPEEVPEHSQSEPEDSDAIQERLESLGYL